MAKLKHKRVMCIQCTLTFIQTLGSVHALCIDPQGHSFVVHFRLVFSNLLKDFKHFQFLGIKFLFIHCYET